MGIAKRVAELISTTDTVSAAASDMVDHAVLDLMAASVGGIDTAPAQASLAAAQRLWGNGDSPCWFANCTLPPIGAAYVNATLASCLDADDGHRGAAGHPGASIIPAVFAVAPPDTPASLLKTAIVVGYEVAIRASAARDLSTVDTLVSGRWCAAGVAAAVAWLRRLPVPQIEQALAITVATAPNLQAVAYSNDMGNHVKEGIPWATATGLAAVELASEHFTGPRDCWDDASRYNSETLTAPFGPAWTIESIYFKPYACCRWSHAAIDAFRLILSAHDIVAADIVSIDVATFRRALQLDNDTAPASLEAAQYSIPYCLALAGLYGDAALLPISQHSLPDPRAVELANKVSLRIDPHLDSLFSTQVPAEVTVTTHDGTYRERVLDPKGDPSNPLEWPTLTKKLHNLADGRLAIDTLESLLAAIEAFRCGNIRPLFSVLAGTAQLSDARAPSHRYPTAHF